MKRIVVILVFLAIGLSGIAQNKWKGFFDPVKANSYFDKDREFRADRGTGVMLWRGAVSFQANQLLYNKAKKYFEPVAYEKIGVGLSYAHYKDVDGSPYNDFSVNGFMFFPLDENSSVSFAVAGSFFQYFELGFGFEPKLINSDYLPVYPFLGAKYTF